MDALVKSLPELSKHIIQAPNGRKSINFSDSLSVKLLNKSLLKCHYGIDYWDIPRGFLCPPIPGRMDYLLAVADEINKKAVVDSTVQALDIGTGANLIYPILGATHLDWQWIASDVEQKSIDNAKTIIEKNSALKDTVHVRKQGQPKHIFNGVIKEGEFFDVTMCNPPFHGSQEEAMKGSERKNKNLQRNKGKRLSKLKGSKVQGSKVQENAKDNLNFSGQSNELWCDGGERRFVSKMITESERYKKQVGLFTCLISKKDNVAPLLKQLNKLGAQSKTVEMAQGNKISRFLAWSFSDV